MSKTKENLLKQFDKYIDNEYCSMVDYDVGYVPTIDKEVMIKNMKERIEKLKEFRKQLKEILDS